jgi:DNA-binding response OmpR family regulator
VAGGYLLLHAAIGAVLRRAGAAPTRRRLGPIEIEPHSEEVRLHDELVTLTATEYRLLVVLAAEPTRVYGKAELLRDVWGYKTPGRTRTLDAHACRLRRKLSTPSSRIVHNVRGVGYRLTAPS